MDELDMIVGQFGNNGGRIMAFKLFVMRGRPFVMELDDDPFSIHPTNAAYHAWDENVQRNVSQNLRLATAVTVTNNHLAQVVREHSDAPVHVLPNQIPAKILDIPRPNNAKLMVGWAGSSTHEHDIMAARQPLSSFLRDVDVDVNIIGADYRHLFRIPQITHTPWDYNMNAYYASLSKLDIGVIPLAASHFNRSKSDLKFIEMSGLGIPVVASAQGPYRESIEHGVTGFLVEHDYEWKKYLRMLINDKELREQMGINARNYARTRTTEGNAHLWETAYQSVLKNVTFATG